MAICANGGLLISGLLRPAIPCNVATLDYITFAIPVFSRYLWLCIDIICERAPSFKQLQHNPRQVACEHTMRGTRAPT